jgi:hypothetical protein
MKIKAPTNALTLIGARICTAEAAQVRKPIIRLQAALLKEKRNDLPQLPNRM